MPRLLESYILCAATALIVVVSAPLAAVLDCLNDVAAAMVARIDFLNDA